MSNEEHKKPSQWAKEKGLTSNVVLKLLRDNGFEVKTAFSPVPISQFATIEKAAEEEKRKQDARNKKKQPAKADEQTPAEQAPAEQTSTTSATGRKLTGTLGKKKPTTPKVVIAPKKPVAKDATKEIAKPEVKEQETTSVKQEVKKQPAPQKSVSQNTDKKKDPPRQVPKVDLKKDSGEQAKPANVQMLSQDKLRKPELKAQVLPPSAEMLARIQKSRQQQSSPQGGRRPNRNNTNNQQGYTGTFGRTSSANSNNNDNNHRRHGQNQNHGNNRSYQQGGGRDGGFTGGSMQDAFGASRNGANLVASMGGPNNASRGGKQGGRNGGKNDRNNERNRNKDRQEQREQQDAVRQNVSRVMASLSKNPVKKVYHKDRSVDESGEEKKILKTSDFITVGELAGLMEQMPARVIAKCMEMGMMVTINARLDFETIQVLADDFGFEAQLMEEYEEDVLGVEEDQEENLQPRSPVVTVMGHVDHGKTSLLDWIRKSHVVAGESGGITQHIGAYEVTTPVGKVTFLDTPGHEAFSAMRARGSQVTDVIVLVVAADSMVMPQTVESIELAHREKVPLVVAITKIDLPTANPDKIRAQLAERGVEVEQWGGTTSCIEVSARSGQGMEELLETLALETEVLELRANPNARAKGAVVESKLDAGKGSMATILIQNGTLHVGDPFVCGIYSGRVRAMFNERGENRKEAGPSTPCQVLGFDGTPQAGDDLIVVEDEKTAREIASKRRMAARERDLRARKTVSLENSFNGVKEGKVSELNLIVKADVGGSAEALAASLEKLSNKEVKVNIIRKGVGAITDSDVLFATTAQAVIIAFHLMPSASIREMAEKDGIEIRTYRVIYDCIEDIQNVVEGLLKPKLREEIIGEAEIRELFKIPKVGMIAGCMVTDGEVNRDSHVRLYRKGVEIGVTHVTSLKRHKDDVKNVARGFECGIGLKGNDNIQVGDTLMFFKKVEVARTLADVAREEAEEKKNAEKKDAE
jgi:translation initiation factor IF-2